MIVSISYNYAESISKQDLSDKCALIMCYGHYISCDSRTRLIICNAIKHYGSKTQADLMLKYKGFDITKECRTYLSTIDLSVYSQNLQRLIVLPSEILIENAMYEWDLYKLLPEIYKHDPQFKNMFALLSKAMKYSHIVPYHGGGFNQYHLLLKQKDSSSYAYVYRLKCCAIFDRDTDDAVSFSHKKNSLFNFLCGKNAEQMNDTDVYTLTQPGGWTWHMWYKRAVENYFPKEKYLELGVNVDEAESSAYGYDYNNIGNIHGYKKNMVPNLSCRMSRADFEKKAKHFNVNGVQMSEIQLLLLKFVKLV